MAKTVISLEALEYGEAAARLSGIEAFREAAVRECERIAAWYLEQKVRRQNAGDYEGGTRSDFQSGASDRCAAALKVLEVK